MRDGLRKGEGGRVWGGRRGRKGEGEGAGGEGEGGEKGDISHVLCADLCTCLFRLRCVLS